MNLNNVTPQNNGLQKMLPVLTVLTGTFLFLVLPWKQFEIDGLIDFQVFYEAAQKIHLKHTVYDVPGHFQYKYSPAIAWIFSKTLLAVSYQKAGIGFTLISIFMWLISGWLCIRAAYHQNGSPSTLKAVAPEISTLLIFIFFGSAFLEELKFGQINWVPFFLSLLFFQLYPNPSLTPDKSPARSLALGGILSLAIQTKLYCSIIGVFLFFQKDWRTLLSLVVMTILLNLGLLSFSYGWDFAVSENIQWITTLTASTQGLIGSKYDVGILGVFTKAFSEPALSKTFWSILVLTSVFSLYGLRKSTPFINFCACFLWIVLINPLVWGYWILLSIPAFAYLLVYWSEKQTPDLRKKLLVLFIIWVSFSAFRSSYAQHGGIALAQILLLWEFFKAHSQQNLPLTVAPASL